jgi:sugar/nucleoside kinase (ribokinase family)
MRVILGNLAIDKIFFDNEKESPGGPPYFIASALKNQKVDDITIVSCAGADFKKSFFPKLKDIKLELIKKQNTTQVGIKRDEFGSDYGFLIDYAGQIDARDIPQKLYDAKIVYVSTVLDDVSPQALKQFNNSLIALDIQGFIRKGSDKRWIRANWDNAKEYLKNVNVLKMSDYEKQFFPMSFEEAVKIGNLEVILLTLGKNGVVAYSNGNYYHMPALAKKVVSSIGAGDYFLTCFTESYHKNRNVSESLKLASLDVASFLENQKLNFSESDLDSMLKITKDLYISGTSN